MDAKLERAEIGSICLVQETEDGRIRQIALREEQHNTLQVFLAMLSQGKPLVQMGEGYDMMLVRDCPKPVEEKRNVLAELEKIEKLPVRKHKVVRQDVYSSTLNMSFDEWWKRTKGSLEYIFYVEYKQCSIQVYESMMGTTKWIEESGRTTEEACRKAITKFYNSYNKVQK